MDSYFWRFVFGGLNEVGSKLWGVEVGGVN